MPIVSSRTNPKIKRRKKEKALRKSRTPTVIVSAALWGLIISIVLFVDPEANGSVETFFVLLIISLVLTLSLITKNTQRAFLIAGGICFFLFLRYIGIGNIFNFLLVVGVAVACEIRLSKRY